MAKEYAFVEIMGHRSHYGRVSEVEKFGAKMLRVDEFEKPAAPLLGEDETFMTFFYGAAAIFSLTPMTEAACRAAWERNRPRPYTPLRLTDDRLYVAWDVAENAEDDGGAAHADTDEWP